MKSIIGKQVVFKTDYMDEACLGVIKRVRLEIVPLGEVNGKLVELPPATLVSLSKCKQIKLVEDKE